MPPQQQTSPGPDFNKTMYWFCENCQKTGKRAKNGFKKHLIFCSSSQPSQAKPADERADRSTTSTSEEMVLDVSSPGWSSDMSLPVRNDAGL
jgi:hypothetical protein